MSRVIIFLIDFTAQVALHQLVLGNWLTIPIARLRCLPEGYAPQGLPRQDWACVQRLQARRRRRRQQARWWQDLAQEDLRACRAREAQPVQEGLLGQSARQRGEEEGGQDHRKEGCSMQEAASGRLLH